MRGPEQGVCAMLGTECCTIIPLHTGPMGPLSALLTRMKAARDQMVRNSGAPDPAWYKWLLSGDWMAGLMRVGMIILVVLLVIAFIACCGLPLVRALIDKTVHSLFGQYMQLQMVDVHIDPDLFPLIMDCLPFRRPPRRPAHRHYSCAYLDSDSNGQAYRFYNASNAPHLYCCFSCRKLAMEIDLSAYRWWLYLKLDREPRRTWRSYPPRSSKDQWVTLPEEARPIPLILSHADIMLEEGSWMAWHQPHEDYCLTDKLVLRVHAYELRRCVSMASLYGPKTKHAYLISRNIQQSTVRQYFTLFFCGYLLWTTHTSEAQKSLARLPPQPAWLHPALKKHGDSEAVVILPKTYYAQTFSDIWVMLRVPPRRVPAPNPRTCGRLRATPRGIECLLNPTRYCGVCHSCQQLSVDILVSDLLWRGFDLGVEPERTWLMYPPPPTADEWHILLDDSRPVPLILDHADLFLQEGQWLHVHYQQDYPLDGRFLLRVHNYDIRSSFCVASMYGHRHKPSAHHAYLLSTHIIQTTTRQYFTLFFCGYQLWTSHTLGAQQGLRHMRRMPKFMDTWRGPVSSRGGGTSDVVSHMLKCNVTHRFRDVWGTLRSGKRVRAPLPLWVRTVHRNHNWWWT
ncbi:hypothetical protein Q7C36_011388 [Tachysurus vachellii]|uniref:Uncharacterized protein n=1 Tax=Tachysurus vachellii TaxID=175792 RepID=A0AA88MU20_TACVA|nr:hypothetical protein Q7C36_011388 [Tachysurus vachellii]